MNKEKQKVVPQLRFPEYQNSEYWTIDKFSSYIKLYRGSSPRPISKYLTTGDNGVNWIKIGDTKNAINFKISKVSEKITIEGSKKSRNVVKGELILANSMSYGATYELDIDGCIYDGWFVLREYENTFDKHFLIQLLNSSFLQTQYKRLAAGGIVQNISSEIVYNTLLPKLSKQEQQKIANCLSSLDNLITAETEKLDHLKDHKKGLLQQLFPAKGETKPQFRFPEFKNEGNWEETILDDVADYENGKAHEKEISETGKYKVVNSKFISTDGRVVKFTDSANLKANIGDILMVLSDIPNGKAIAKCFYVDKEDTYTVNQRICKITPTGIDNKFLFYIQNRNKYFLAFDDGVKQTNLRKDTVLSFPFLKPKNPKEQQKIANCLSSADDLIQAQKIKIKNLKNHKKGLLQQLFPNSL
tara:strand:+ start:3375 stop:4619 length:1245 start_codon:yes stop_codon:yes gene_type:complete